MKGYDEKTFGTPQKKTQQTTPKPERTEPLPRGEVEQSSTLDRNAAIIAVGARIVILLIGFGFGIAGIVVGMMNGGDEKMIVTGVMLILICVRLIVRRLIRRR